MRQLHAQNGGLDRVETAVPAHFFMKISSRAAMIPQAFHMLCIIAITRRDYPSIAIRTQVLGGIKTEGGGCSQRSGASLTPICADGLGSIRHNRSPELFHNPPTW